MEICVNFFSELGTLSVPEMSVKTFEESYEPCSQMSDREIDEEFEAIYQDVSSDEVQNVDEEFQKIYSLSVDHDAIENNGRREDETVSPARCVSGVITGDERISSPEYFSASSSPSSEESFLSFPSPQSVKKTGKLFLDGSKILDTEKPKGPRLQSIHRPDRVLSSLERVRSDLINERRELGEEVSDDEVMVLEDEARETPERGTDQFERARNRPINELKIRRDENKGREMRLLARLRGGRESSQLDKERKEQDEESLSKSCLVDLNSVKTLTEEEIPIVSAEVKPAHEEPKESLKDQNGNVSPKQMSLYPTEKNCWLPAQLRKGEELDDNVEGSEFENENLRGAPKEVVTDDHGREHDGQEMEETRENCRNNIPPVEIIEAVGNSVEVLDKSPVAEESSERKTVFSDDLIQENDSLVAMEGENLASSCSPSISEEEFLTKIPVGEPLEGKNVHVEQFREDLEYKNEKSTEVKPDKEKESPNYTKEKHSTEINMEKPKIAPFPRSTLPKMAAKPETSEKFQTFELPLIKPATPITRPMLGTIKKSQTVTVGEFPVFFGEKLTSPISDCAYESVYSDRFRRGRSLDLPSPTVGELRVKTGEKNSDAFLKTKIWDKY